MADPIALGLHRLDGPFRHLLASMRLEVPSLRTDGKC